MCCWALLRGLPRMTLAFMRMRAGLVANLKNNSVQCSIRLHYRWFLARKQKKDLCMRHVGRCGA